jgi:hypothetical protein
MVEGIGEIMKALPWLIVMVVLGLVGWCTRVLYSRDDTPLAYTADRVADIRDSLHAEHTVDSLRLLVWTDSVLALRGDSLRRVLGRHAQTVRVRDRIDTLRDTVHDSVMVPAADVRTLLIADSACQVRVDSLEGSVLVATTERDQADSATRQAKRSARVWQAATVGLGVVLVVKMIIN